MDEQRFRKELYESFSAKGIPEILKLHMRTSLVKGLRDGSFPKKSDSPDDFGKQLTDRLVYRHLQRSGYNYTLSVFAPEAGLHGSEATPNIDDILQMLNVMPGSIAHAQIKKLCESEEHAKASDLWLIVKCLLGCFGADPHSTRVSTGMQTGSSAFDFSSSASTFSDKLRAIDEEFEQRQHVNESSVSERLNSMRREMEQRYKLQLQTEIQRVRQNDVARIRLELEEKSRKEIATLKSQVECAYEERLLALQRREEASAESARGKMTSLEREAYQQRQHALEQIEAMRKREVAINRHADMQQRNLSLVEAKLKETEKALDSREMAVNQLEASYESKLYQAEMRAREQIKAEYASRLACVERDEIAVEQQKSAIEQSSEKLKHLSEIELKMEECRVEVESLRRQNEINQERLEEMNDYHKLKQENILLSEEVHSLKRSLDDVIATSARHPLNSERYLTSRAISEQGPSLLGSSRRVPASSNRAGGGGASKSTNVDHVPSIDVIDIEDNSADRERWRSMNAQTVSLMKQMSSELAQLKMQMAMSHQHNPNNMLHPPPLNPSQQFPAAGFGFVNPKPTQFAAPPPPTNPPEILTDDIPDISTSSTDEDLLAGYRRPGGGPLAGRGSSTIFRKQEESYQGLGFLTDSRSKMQTLAQEADHLETRYKTYSQRLSMLAQETYKMVSDPIKEHPNDQSKQFRAPDNVETFEPGPSSNTGGYPDVFKSKPGSQSVMTVDAPVSIAKPATVDIPIPLPEKTKITSDDIPLFDDSDRSLLSPIDHAPGNGDTGAQLSDGEDIVAGSFIQPRGSGDPSSSGAGGKLDAKTSKESFSASPRKSSNINKDLSEAFKFNLHTLSEERSALGHQPIEEAPKTSATSVSHRSPQQNENVVNMTDFGSEEFLKRDKTASPLQRLEPVPDDREVSLSEVLEQPEDQSNDEVNFEEENNDIVLDDYGNNDIDTGRHNLVADESDLNDFGPVVDNNDIPDAPVTGESNDKNEGLPETSKKASFRNVFAYSQELSDEDAKYSKAKDTKKQDDDFYDSDFEMSLNNSNRQPISARSVESPTDLFLGDAGDPFRGSTIETADLGAETSKGQGHGMETGDWQSKSGSDDSF